MRFGEFGPSIDDESLAEKFGAVLNLPTSNKDNQT